MRPDKVKIGPCVYSIVYTAETFVEDTTVWGQINYRTKIITVALKPQQETATLLLHEIMHGIAATWNIRYNKMSDEAVTVALGMNLSVVMQDNPSLFAWIQKELASYVANPKAEIPADTAP